MNAFRINTSAPNLMCICIDGQEENSINGRLYHKYIPVETPVRFPNLGGLLRVMDNVFDKIGYPERSTQRRSFTGSDHIEREWKEAAQVTPTESLLIQTGEIATFVVHVKFRQYSTWQGEVVWAEKNKKCSFRSALELLKLIDGALDEADEGLPDQA